MYRRIAISTVSLVAGALLFSPAISLSVADEVRCAGSYPYHLQGVCRGDDGALFWCFTTELVKTDGTGKLLKSIPVASHHGDLCFHDGRVYVAVNLGKFNRPEGAADSWIYVYDAAELAFLAKHEVPEVVHGAGGIAARGEHFFVVGGLPPETSENYVYEYDAAFRFVRRHTLASGYTVKGIQTAAFDGAHWWFGCYGKPQELLRSDATFGDVRRFTFDAAYGIVPLADGTLLVARDRVVDMRHVARLVAAKPDAARGLVEVDQR